MNERLEKHLIELEEDITLREINLKEKALKCPGIKLKWIRIYHSEKGRLTKLKDAEDILVKAYIKNQTNKTVTSDQIPKHLKNEASSKDPRIKQIQKEITKQYAVIDGLKDIVTYIIAGFGYDISNSEKCLKMELDF